MNATIIYKSKVESNVLDELSKELPVIIAEVMEVPGGNLARLKPEQVSIHFSQANSRDVGADIRIMVFAKSNLPRTSTGNDRANAILERVIALNTRCGGECSIDIRLYLMDIGAAEYSVNG